VTGKRDEGSRSEVRGFRNFEPRASNFVSLFSRQARFFIYPQCPISIRFLSKKLDSVTHCVYSYRM
jgi:hypothetical protein